MADPITPNASYFNSTHTGETIDTAVEKVGNTTINGTITENISGINTSIDAINNKIGNTTINGTITENISVLKNDVDEHDISIKKNATELNNKVSKQNNENSVYTNNASGAVTMTKYSVAPEQGTFVVRDGSGNVNVNTPANGINGYGKDSTAAISYKSLANIGGDGHVVIVANSEPGYRQVEFFYYSSSIVENSLSFPLRKRNGDLLANTVIDDGVVKEDEKDKILINYGYLKKFLDLTNFKYLHKFTLTGPFQDMSTGPNYIYLSMRSNYPESITDLDLFLKEVKLGLIVSFEYLYTSDAYEKIVANPLNVKIKSGVEVGKVSIDTGPIISQEKYPSLSLEKGSSWENCPINSITDTVSSLEE